MQRGKRTLAQPHHVRFRDAEMFQHRGDVVGGLSLPVRGVLLGNIGGRVSARVEGDASIVARKPSDLGLPFAMVGGELMHKNYRMAVAGLLEVEFYSR